MNGLKAHIHKIVLGGIALFWVFSFLYYHHWRNPEKLFRYDVGEYYIYLPATFIYGDLSFQFLDSLESSYFKEHTSVYLSETGKRVSKMSPGMAIMYSPFFLIAHVSALINKGPANGYTGVYSFWIAFSGFVYAWLGLLVLYRILLKLFNKKASIWTILSIGLGTNLLYYSSSEPAMSHAAGFFLISCGIWLTMKWKEESQQKYGILLGLVIGLIFLVRPVNIFFVLFPLLYDWRSKDGFINKLISRPFSTIGLILSGFVMLSFQLILWKWKTGQFFYFSYQGEGFDFSNPHVWECLVGFRKGWLVYTPIMLFGILGLFIRDKALKPFMPAIPIILIVLFYVLSSWWCWWYGGSFGFRPMVEWYALLAIPFAALVNKIGGIKRRIFGVFIGLLILLNMFQTHQYNYQTIHWDAMTWPAYKKVFLKRLPPKDFERYLDTPDYTLPGVDTNE